MKSLIAIAAVALIGLSGVSLAADPANPANPAPYPLQTCIISGEKFGEMGKPVVFTYEGQEIKLCCNSCKKTFDKNPAKYMKIIQDAAAKKS